MRMLARATTICLVLAGLSGCTADIAELRAEVDQIKQTPAPPLEPIPVMKEPDRYVYQSSGMRDPFISGDQVDDVQSNPDEPRICEGPQAPDMNRAKELLESYPLDSLDMVGTLVQSGTTFGLIKDPDGVVHRVLSGNYLGQNFGVITMVGEDRIVVDERHSDGNGCWEAKSAEIALEDSVQ